MSKRKTSISVEFNIDSNYWIYADYNTYNSDDECDHNYCSCSKVDVSSIKIANCDYSGLFYNITKSSHITNIKHYCLDRGLRKLISDDDFNYNVVNGYYGEEVSVEFSTSALSRLKNFITFLNKNSNTKCIEKVLEIEYGFVIDRFKNKRWQNSSVDISLIKTGNAIKSVDNKLVEEYKLRDRKGKNIICLCSKSGNTYKLIDGYHRFSAAKRDDKKEVNIIYCVTS